MASIKTSTGKSFRQHTNMWSPLVFNNSLITGSQMEDSVSIMILIIIIISSKCGGTGKIKNGAGGARLGNQNI